MSPEFQVLCPQEKEIVKTKTKTVLSCVSILVSAYCLLFRPVIHMHSIWQMPRGIIAGRVLQSSLISFSQNPCPSSPLFLNIWLFSNVLLSKKNLAFIVFLGWRVSLHKLLQIACSSQLEISFFKKL